MCKDTPKRCICLHQHARTYWCSCTDRPHIEWCGHTHGQKPTSQLCKQQTIVWTNLYTQRQAWSQGLELWICSADRLLEELNPGCGSFCFSSIQRYRLSGWFAPPGLPNHSSASEFNPLPHCSMGTRRACPPSPEKGSGRGLVGGLQLGCPMGAWVEGQGTSLGAQRPQFGFRLRCPRPTHGLSELHSEPPLLEPCDTLRDLSMGKSTETVSHDELLKQLETLSWRTAGLGGKSFSGRSMKSSRVAGTTWMLGAPYQEEKC